MELLGRSSHHLTADWKADVFGGQLGPQEFVASVS